MITPNEEKQVALGDQNSVIRPLAKELHKQAKCKNLILKCGDRGLITYRSHKEKILELFVINHSLKKLIQLEQVMLYWLILL